MAFLGLVGGVSAGTSPSGRVPGFDAWYKNFIGPSGDVRRVVKQQRLTLVPFPRPLHPLNWVSARYAEHRSHKEKPTSRAGLAW